MVQSTSDQCKGALQTTSLDKGTLSRVLMAEAANVPVSIYNAGDIPTNGWINYALEASNSGTGTARVYLNFDESTVNGCESLHSHFGTYAFDVPAGGTTNLGEAGSNFYLCATPGPSYTTISVYNGIGLADNVAGDPATDELLKVTVLQWTYVANTIN